MRLIESSARRRRHPLGIAASVVVHMTVIALAVTATARAADQFGSTKPETITTVYTAPPPESRTLPTHARSGAPSSSSSAPTIPTAPLVDITDLPSIDVPPIDVTTMGDPSAAASRSFANGPRLGSGIGSGDGPTTGDVLDAMTVDRAVIALPGTTPRYPETLRAAGISGRVVARFVVDTLGRVEPADVAITSTSHPAFADAVRRVLPAMRFRPAEARGRHVRQLVEMPFEFVVR